MFILVRGRVCFRQAAEHDVGQAQVDIGAAAGHLRFVFTAEQAEASRPAEGAFYDPAVRQNHEPRLVITAFDDPQFPTELLRGGLHQLASLAAIGPDLFESCLTAHRSEDLRGSVAILHAVCAASRRSSSAMKRASGVGHMAAAASVRTTRRTMSLGEVGISLCCEWIVERSDNGACQAGHPRQQLDGKLDEQRGSQ